MQDNINGLDVNIYILGNLNQPKWGHLKQLHTLLKSMEKPLTYGNISTIDLGNSVTVRACPGSSLSLIINYNIDVIINPLVVC